jgi:hypothetical protein
MTEEEYDRTARLLNQPDVESTPRIERHQNDGVSI